jgi:homoserine O-succinyltransferase
VNEVNSQFNVPHSRYNQITEQQCKEAGLMVLVRSEAAGVHLITSEDGFKIVMFQGHPEYDAISLLKEYKRETSLFFAKKRPTYPLFPEHYFNQKTQTILREYQYYKSDIICGGFISLSRFTEF